MDAFDNFDMEWSETRLDKEDYAYLQKNIMGTYDVVKHSNGVVVDTVSQEKAMSMEKAKGIFISLKENGYKGV